MTHSSLHAWRVRVLGGLSIEQLGEHGDLRRLDLILQRRQTLALLAILAVAGRRGVARERLLELLWPDGDTIQTRNALAQLLFRTRRTLGRTALTGRQTLRLCEDVVSSDLVEFRAAIERGEQATAVALYTGPLLDGVLDWETPALVRWVAEQRARLDAEYRNALQRVEGSTPRAPEARPRAFARRGIQAGGLLIIIGLVAALASSFYVQHATERRPRTVLVPAFDNETGDTSFDSICREAAAAIAADISNARFAQPTTSSGSAQALRQAVSVQASLFRLGTDSLVLFVRFVRSRDGRILAADKPLVVGLAHRDQLITLARQRVLAFFSGQDTRSDETP